MNEVVERELARQATAVARAELTVEEIKGWIGGAYSRVAGAVSAAGSGIAGPPFARYHRIEGAPGRFEVEAGFPVTQPVAPAGLPGDVLASDLPAGRAAVTVHVGPYEAMAPAYEALEKWIADRGGSPQGPPWEIYLSEPTGDPAQWRTEIVQPFA